MSLKTRLAAAEIELALLRSENASLKNILADNLCWMDADPQGARALPPEQMLESCKRFISQISSAQGILCAGQMTIAQLEMEIMRLRDEISQLKGNLIRSDMKRIGVDFA